MIFVDYCILVLDSISFGTSIDSMLHNSFFITLREVTGLPGNDIEEQDIDKNEHQHGGLIHVS